MVMDLKEKRAIDNDNLFWSQKKAVSNNIFYGVDIWNSLNATNFCII